MKGVSRASVCVCEDLVVHILDTKLVLSFDPYKCARL